MTLIWKSGYTTGVPEMDAQHQRAFDQLNELESLIEQGRYVGDEIADHVKAIFAHAERHFSDEECCMDKAHCPMALKNREEHAYFLEAFRQHMSAYEKAPSQATLSELHGFAEQWLHEHIAFVDIHLRSCVQSG